MLDSRRCLNNLPKGTLTIPRDRQPQCPDHNPTARISPRSRSFYDRFGDTVFRCAGGDPALGCSWAWSEQIGLFVPAGLNHRSVVYPQMYYLKRRTPETWQALYAPVIDRFHTQMDTPS